MNNIKMMVPPLRSTTSLTKTDPLRQGPEAAKELLKRFGGDAEGFPADVVIDAAMNLLINAVRQTQGQRPQAHARVDQITARMHEIVDLHYDAVTQKRRSVFAFDQTVQMVFTDDRKRV